MIKNVKINFLHRLFLGEYKVKKTFFLSLLFLSSVTHANTPPAPPICEVGADPQTIQPGAGTALWWWTSAVASANIDKEIGSITVPSDYKWIYPTETTTYTMTAIGQNGTPIECQIEIVVDPQAASAAPLCEMGVDPQVIDEGEGTALWWWSDDVASASIDNNISSVTVPSDYSWITPSETTTYTMSAVGEGGETSSCATTITVVPNGTVEGFDEDLINAFIRSQHSNFANVMGIVYSLDKANAFAHVNMRGIEKIFVYDLTVPQTPVHHSDIPYGINFYFKDIVANEGGMVTFTLVEVEGFNRDNPFISRPPTGVEYTVVYDYVNKNEVSKILVNDTPDGIDLERIRVKIEQALETELGFLNSSEVMLLEDEKHLIVSVKSGNGSYIYSYDITDSSLNTREELYKHTYYSPRFFLLKQVDSETISFQYHLVVLGSSNTASVKFNIRTKQFISCEGVTLICENDNIFDDILEPTSENDTPDGIEPPPAPLE